MNTSDVAQVFVTGIAVGSILYVVLCAYLALVGYELWLLSQLGGFTGIS